MRASGPDGAAHFRPRQRHARIILCGRGHTPKSDTIVSGSSTNAASMTLQHGPGIRLTCLARGIPTVDKGRGRKGESGAPVALMGDEEGRLFIVNAKDRRVTAV